MRSKIGIVGLIVLAGVVARDVRASVCSLADEDTSPSDRQMFLCQGGPNPLPVNGSMDPRFSIFFAQYGRISIDPPPGCDAPAKLAPVIFPSCTIVPCPDPSAISDTGGRQWSFFIQDNDRWHLDNNQWSDNGKSDTIFYDLNQPYSKVLNAAYLVWFGLKDDENVLFHGTADYVDLARANDSNYHSTFFRSVPSATDYDGEFIGNFVGDDEVQTTCNIFVGKGLENNVLFRVATNLHEAWHAWENLYLQRTGIPHQFGTGHLGTCTLTGDQACDPFYTHPLDSFRPFGTLWNGVGVDPNCPVAPRDCAHVIDRDHSPNQVSWEFVCDLVTSPADWVTQINLVGDAPAALTDYESRFINEPPFQCMNSHPMMSPS